MVLAVGLMLFAASDPDALSESAKAAALQKRYDEAAALWNRALAVSPQHFPSLFNFAYMRYTQSRYAEAEPLLARATRVQPQDFNTRYLLGATMIQLGKREAGLREWRAALLLQPSNLKLIQIMALEYGNGQYFRESCDLARRALALRQDDPDIHLIGIKACQDAGDAGAFDMARRAVELFPNSARANFEYGFQLRKKGRTSQSALFLQKAMEADPSYEEPFFFYGEMLLSEDRYEEAAKYLAKALEIRPDYTAACVSLSKALTGAQKDEDAIRQLTTCIRMSPGHPQPHLLLAQIYFRLGNEQKAQAEKEISLRLRRSNPSTMESPQARPFPVPERPH